MRFKISRYIPLSVILSILPGHPALAQGADEDRVEVLLEDPGDEAGEDPKNPDADDPRVERARLDLKEAQEVAEQATGAEKAKAAAKLALARKRLENVIKRSEAKEGKASRHADKGAAKSAKNQRNDGKEPRPTAVDKGKGKKAAERDEANRELSPGNDEQPKSGDANRKEPGRPGPSREDRRMKPGRETEPAPVREVRVESKQEVKEAKDADLAVDRTARRVEEKADRRKLGLKDKGEARAMIRELIGAESEVSKAEAARETRLEPRVRGNRRQGGGSRDRDEIRSASEFLLRQLSGRSKPEEAPAFFRRPAGAEPRRDSRDDGRRRPAAGGFQSAPPRYYHEGRRYVRFDSRNSIPAILLAAAALDRVSVQPAERVDRYFRDERGSHRYANELPPETYRGKDSVVVSYPVSQSSMISSNDIIFAQGSTRFADGHSYDMLMALADAIANPALSDARFVIEGHASAEGSYDDNMVLSQRRAEAIVRDLVREGIDPERLIPVGYGESEARYPADAPERNRSLDRNVRVFRIDGE